MSNRSIVQRAFLGAALIILASAAALDAAKIEWQSSEGAAGYQVEIADKTGRGVLHKNTTDTFLEAELEPGSYRVRISPLNKFGKPGRRGEWHPLDIIKAVEPEVSSLSKQVFENTSSTDKFIISGVNIIEGIVVSLEKDEQKRQLESLYSPDRSEISVEIDPSSLTPGWHDLVLLNPGGGITVMKKQILISKNPTVKSFSPGIISSNALETRVNISGENIYHKSFIKLFLRGKEVAEIPLEVDSDISADFNITPSKLSPGVYSARLINYQSGAFTYDRALTVTADPYIESVSRLRFRGDETEALLELKGKNFIEGAELLLEKEDTEPLRLPLEIIESGRASVKFLPSQTPTGAYLVSVENPGKLRYSSKEKLHITPPFDEEYRLFTGISFGYSVILPPWRGFLSDSFKGADLYLGYHLYQLPVNQYARFLGLEAGLGFRSYINDIDTDKAMQSLLNINLAAGGYLLSEYFTPFDILLRCGTGLLISRVSLREDGVENDLLLVSYLLYGGLSIRYQIYGPLFAEAGIDYSALMYYNNPMQEIRPYLRIIAAF